MKEVSIEEIETIARTLAREKKLWHYHLLTPTCRFNIAKKHAFVVENNTDGIYFVYYSETPAMELGKKLLSVLHGDDILAKSVETAAISPSTEKILKKAEQLNAKGKYWHHHVFFPVCTYNNHPGKWNITFEDQEHGTVLESLNETNPKQDQTEIERLYYQQKTIA